MFWQTKHAITRERSERTLKNGRNHAFGNWSAQNSLGELKALNASALPKKLQTFLGTLYKLQSGNQLFLSSDSKYTRREPLTERLSLHIRACARVLYYCLSACQKSNSRRNFGGLSAKIRTPPLWENTTYLLTNSPEIRSAHFCAYSIAIAYSRKRTKRFYIINNHSVFSCACTWFTEWLSIMWLKPPIARIGNLHFVCVLILRNYRT